MNANEIVKALRDDFAPQVREMCADDDFECDELCAGNVMTAQCIVFQAADLITSQQAEIDRLTALNKEAVGLLELAVEDMQYCSDGLDCEACGNSTCAGFDVCRFVWQHADRYEALKKKMEDTP